MKSRIPLLLMEQMVMLLVFALSAALCLQAFVLSDGISERSDNRDRAVTLVQETAETVRHYGGVEAAARDLMGLAKDEEGTPAISFDEPNRLSGQPANTLMQYKDGTLSLFYDESWNPGETQEVYYVLKAEEIPSGTPGLGMARVTLEPCAAPAEPLFEVTVAWQEALPDAGEVDSNGA